MTSTPRPARWFAVLSLALALAGCGGGGGGSVDTVPPPPGALGPSSQYAGICTLEGQKQFVRSYLDEVYLWYREIPAVDPAAYGNIVDYFDALLVKTPDANGLPRDRFSTVLPAGVAQDLSVRRYTGASGLGVVPSTLAVQAAGADSVPLTQVVASPSGRKTGYILFLDHDEGSQDALINSFRQLRDAGVQDLVLDLRYNAGGFLYVALAAASMVTGPQSEGLVFEQLRYNDKRVVDEAATGLLYSSRLQFAETQYPRGTELPQLGLPRLYVLTSGQTCSASESLINSLRGINVEVNIIGQTTCGKPYGFQRKDNCGLAYFPLEFQGFNAKGFGDYTAGFQPTCAVAENAAATLGSTDEPLLAAALRHIDAGTCPPAASSLQMASSPKAGAVSTGPVRPAWAGRLLGPGR